MDTNEHELMVLTHHPAATLRPLTVADYHRMAEAGIFAEHERVELIEGQLIAMSPIGSPHIAAVIALTASWCWPSRARVSCRSKAPCVLVIAVNLSRTWLCSAGGKIIIDWLCQVRRTHFLSSRSLRIASTTIGA